MATVVQGDQTGYIYENITTEDINRIINYLPFNAQSLEVFIMLRQIVRNADQFEINNQNDVEVQRIREISQTYRDIFLKLSNIFPEWRQRRENLIQWLEWIPKVIDNTFLVCSGIRFTTSAADLYTSIVQATNGRNRTIAGYSIGSISILGVFSLFGEKLISKILNFFTKKKLDEDKKYLNKIKNLFKQAEELDEGVKTLFSYGIDEEIPLKIGEVSTDDDPYLKIFISVVASNVKKDSSLSKNLEFLEKADLLECNREAGLNWFQKVIVERDPVFMDSACVAQEMRIQQAVRKFPLIGTSDAYKNFPVEMYKLKAILDTINIGLTVVNVWMNTSKEKSNPIRALAKKAEKELESVKTVINLLQPCGS